MAFKDQRLGCVYKNRWSLLPDPYCEGGFTGISSVIVSLVALAAPPLEKSPQASLYLYKVVLYLNDIIGVLVFIIPNDCWWWSVSIDIHEFYIKSGGVGGGWLTASWTSDSGSFIRSHRPSFCCATFSQLFDEHMRLNFKLLVLFFWVFFFLCKAKSATSIGTVSEDTVGSEWEEVCGPTSRTWTVWPPEAAACEPVSLRTRWPRGESKMEN